MGPTGNAEHVSSPCISVCTMDPVSGLCAGCYRTLDEIAGWIGFSNETKRALIAVLPARRSRLGGLTRAPDATDGQR
jgi:predicted Fe-S protein YdhL (DUF1289 family)